MSTANTWAYFPLHLEQKINALIFEAEPSSHKAYQLYKACKNDNLWQNSFELFNVHLTDFFSQAPDIRQKSYFDNFLDRPMSRNLFEQFKLDFGNAKINPQSMLNIATWANQSIRDNCRTNSPVVSTDIIDKAIQDVTTSSIFEKTEEIDFEDFCFSWKKVTFSFYGNQYDSDLEIIIKEIRWLKQRIKSLQAKKEQNQEQKTPIKTIYLTQTEIAWVEAIKHCVLNNALPTKYPLSAGPQKAELIDLHRASILYQLILESHKHEVFKHKESVKNKILILSNYLLENCRR